MAEPTTNLRVRFGAELADLKAALTSVRGDLAKLKGDSARSLDGLDTASGKLRNFVNGTRLALTAVAGILGGAAAAIKSAVDRADEMGKAAQKVGSSAENFSKLVYAAKLSEVGMDQLTTGLIRFDRQLVINESSIKKLGIATRDLKTGAFRDTTEIVKDLAAVFAALPDGPEKAALALKLFGRAGADLIPLLNQGREGIQALGDEAAATGQVISNEAALAADEFNDNLDRLKGTVIGVTNQVAQELLPAFRRYAAAAVESANSSNAAADAGSFLADAFKVVATGAVAAKNIIEGMVNVLGFLVDAAAAAGRAVATVFVPQFFNLANIKNIPAQMRASFDAMRTGVGDSIKDAKQFKDAMFGTFANVRGQFASTSAAARKAAPDISELLRGSGSKGGSTGKSEAERKAEQLRRELERLEEQSKRSLERLREAEIKREEELTKQLTAAENELLRATGRTADAEFREIDAKYAELLTALKNNGNAAGVAIIEQLIPIQKIRARLDEFRTRMQEIKSTLQTGETAISAQAGAGMLGQTAAEERMRGLRAEALQQLTDLRSKVEAYYAATKDPSVLAFLQELRGNIGEVSKSQDRLMQQAQDVAVSSLATLFSDLATGAKSAKDAFKDFVRNFVQGIAQMIAQQLALTAVKAAARALGFAVVHTGGIVGQGGAVRQVNPLLLGHAPRYHSGGIAGLGPKEVPAILERGEEVLTRNDPRHVRNQGKGRDGGGLRVVLLDDARRIGDFIDSPEGDKVIVRAIQRNEMSLRMGRG